MTPCYALGKILYYGYEYMTMTIHFEYSKPHIGNSDILNDDNRIPQLSLLVISNSKDNCWKGHQFQNNQHTLVQCCPCFRQQVPLNRAPGVSPSVIVVLVSDNSWPIIKLCRNKIFPNGAQGHYFKGGVRADQSENSRSFNHQIFH